MGWGSYLEAGCITDVGRSPSITTWAQCLCSSRAGQHCSGWSLDPGHPNPSGQHLHLLSSRLGVSLYGSFIDLSLTLFIYNFTSLSLYIQFVLPSSLSLSLSLSLSPSLFPLSPSTIFWHRDAFQCLASSLKFSISPSVLSHESTLS